MPDAQHAGHGLRQQARPPVQGPVRPARRDRARAEDSGPAAGLADQHGSDVQGRVRPVRRPAFAVLRRRQADGRRTDARHKARRPGDRRVHQSVHTAPARRSGARRRRLSSVRTRQLPQGRGRAGLFRQRIEQFRSPRAARLLRPYRAVARQVAYAPARRVALRGETDRIRVQDPCEHGPEPPRPDRVSENLLGSLRAQQALLARAFGQNDQVRVAHGLHGREKIGDRRGIPRRHRRAARHG